ncbi:hypothetical protein AOQ72_16880 [Bradyrhizobium yuanmingense]|uniref:Uncharacterized protein n=1 Tax=Bradyrhizobium yuanmingense TaxID=108015 RepID=A0A0R3CUH1_9BRAD|nr:hypothetical protein AOQ72_16880 [Bradyrhizobium yuanmingense]
MRTFGGMALTAAGFYPHRIAAGASFRGGNLATDLSVSPHLQAARIRARMSPSPTTRQLSS